MTDELLNIHRSILAIGIIFFFYLSELNTEIILWPITFLKWVATALSAWSRMMPYSERIVVTQHCQLISSSIFGKNLLRH